jgi:hypothetical protein
MIPRYAIFHHTAAKSSAVPSYRQVQLAKSVAQQRYGGRFKSVYHIMVTADGQITEIERPNVVIPHCGLDNDEWYINNQNSIGICCGANLEEEHMGPAMKKGLIEVIKSVSKNYNIPMNNFFPHRALIPTQCPGKNFPFDEVMKEAFMPDQPKPWYHDVLEWAKANKIVVGNEFGVIDLNEDQLRALVMLWKYHKNVIEKR